MANAENVPTWTGNVRANTCSISREASVMSECDQNWDMCSAFTENLFIYYQFSNTYLTVYASDKHRNTFSYGQLRKASVITVRF